MVWTARGQIPIEQVRVDDWVLAQDETTGAVSLRLVVETFVREGAPIVEVRAESAAGEVETFRTTEEHPFFVPCRGWVAAGVLTPGDALVALDGEGWAVASITFTGEQATVYNLEVEGLHDYYVGASGVLVHNSACKLRPLTRANFSHNLSLRRPKPGPDYQAHHIIPHRFESLFPNKNLNDPSTNGAWVHKQVHLGRGSLTSEWEHWARQNPNATAADVLRFATDLESRAGLWLIKP